MNKLLEGSLLVAILVILYLVWELFRHKKKIRNMRERVKSHDAHPLIVESTPQPPKPNPAPSDTLETHDKIIELFESGATIESICETLKIPQSKAEMTLKFEKMKKNGS